MAERAASSVPVTWGKSSRVMSLVMAKHFIQTITNSLRGLNPHDVRTMAMRTVTIGIGSTSDPGCSAILKFLGNTDGVFLVGAPQGPEKFDIEIYEEGVPAPRNGFTFHPGRTEELIARILAEREELSLPLARAFPGFRRAVSQKYISSVSKENATFSFVMLRESGIWYIHHLEAVEAHPAGDSLNLYYCGLKPRPAAPGCKRHHVNIFQIRAKSTS